jgi:hypothetical protein
MTKTILVKAVTRRSAVQKITGALGEALPPVGLKKAEVGAALANCRALLNQIDAGLSAKKLFLNVSSAAELLFYLEFAASALEKAAPRPRKRGGTKLALNSHWWCRACEPFPARAGMFSTDFGFAVQWHWQPPQGRRKGLPATTRQW